MLRLFLLGLILTATTVKSDDTEGSADGDDEEDDEEVDSSSGTGFLRNGKGDTGNDVADGSTTIIIIAAVSVVVLAIVAIVVILLFRRHLRNREQGVYTVPVEQREKGDV